MACMLFLQSPQKHNQRTFTSTNRRYSVLLNFNGKKKSRSEKKVSKNQLVEESHDDDDDDDDDEVISNVGGQYFHWQYIRAGWWNGDWEH